MVRQGLALHLPARQAPAAASESWTFPFDAGLSCRYRTLCLYRNALNSCTDDMGSALPHFIIDYLTLQEAELTAVAFYLSLPLRPFLKFRKSLRPRWL